MIRLSILVVVFVCGHTLALDPDEPLVRCPRELCSLVCENGQKTDEKGCFICECLEDPCKRMPCPRGEKCVNSRKCAGNPCNELLHTCESFDNAFPCAMPMCSDFCPHGFLNNENGCMTCNCATDACQEHKCPDGHRCKEEVSPGRGPGGVTEYIPFCAPIGDQMPQSEAPLNMKDSLSQLSDFPPLCELRKMGLNDPKLLSHYQLAEVQWKDRKQSEVKCSEDGHSFEPLQCNAALKQCWCETDAGAIVPNSIGDGVGLQCVPHQTTQVIIVMVFSHQMPAIEEPEDLERVVVAQINVWTDVGLEAIEVTEILPMDSQVQITFTLTSSEHVVYISERLRWMLIKEDHSMTYKQSEMTIDPDKVSINPVSKPVSSGGLMEEPDHPVSCRFSNVWRSHKLGVIIGAVGLLLFILAVVVAIVKVCCKKSARRQYLHQRMSQYSENLSFSGDVYGKENEKPAVLVIEDMQKEADA